MRYFQMAAQYLYSSRMHKVKIVASKFLQWYIVQHCCTVQTVTCSHLWDCISQRFSQPSQNSGTKKKVRHTQGSWQSSHSQGGFETFSQTLRITATTAQ